jgi:hypothetical protein
LIEAVKLAAFLFGEDAVAAEGRQQTGHQGRIVSGEATICRRRCRAARTSPRTKVNPFQERLTAGRRAQRIIPLPGICVSQTLITN